MAVHPKKIINIPTYIKYTLLEMINAAPVIVINMKPIKRGRFNLMHKKYKAKTTRAAGSTVDTNESISPTSIGLWNIT